MATIPTYQDFLDRTGAPDKFTKEIETRFLDGENAAHCVAHLAEYKDGKILYSLLTEKTIVQFLQFLDMIEGRGAVRGESYFICTYLEGSILIMVCHTTNKFVSTEDTFE